MAFDPSTARPLGGFDPSTARPVGAKKKAPENYDVSGYGAGVPGVKELGSPALVNTGNEIAGSAKSLGESAAGGFSKLGGSVGLLGMPFAWLADKINEGLGIGSPESNQNMVGGFVQNAFRGGNEAQREAAQAHPIAATAGGFIPGIAQYLAPELAAVGKAGEIADYQANRPQLPYNPAAAAENMGLSAAFSRFAPEGKPLARAAQFGAAGAGLPWADYAFGEGDKPTVKDTAISAALMAALPLAHAGLARVLAGSRPVEAPVTPAPKRQAPETAPVTPNLDALAKLDALKGTKAPEKPPEPPPGAQTPEAAPVQPQEPNVAQGAPESAHIDAGVLGEAKSLGVAIPTAKEASDFFGLKGNVTQQDMPYYQQDLLERRIRKARIATQPEAQKNASVLGRDNEHGLETPKPESAGEGSGAYEDFVNKAGKRFAMENQGQHILDTMEESGESPHRVADKFWNDTYWKLNGENQQRFKNYVKSLSGWEPGSVVAVGADGERVTAKDWPDVAKHWNGDLPQDAGHLEGTERGYVAMMKWANEKAEGQPEATQGANKAELPALGKPPVLTATDNIPNTGSINGYFKDQTVERGIHEVPLDKIPDAYVEASKPEKLAREIAQSGKIDPVIIGIDSKGEHSIIEGAHRVAALHRLGVKSVPAIVVRETKPKYTVSMINGAISVHPEGRSNPEYVVGRYKSADAAWEEADRLNGDNSAAPEQKPAQESAPSEPKAQELSAVSEKGAPVERRQDLATRKKVAEMTSEERNQALLTHDLTGLPNRRAFNEQPEAPAHAVIDVNGLKPFNDVHGHQVGDQAVNAVAQTLKNEGLDVYHVSGDEFVVRGQSTQALGDALNGINEKIPEVKAGDGTIKPDVSYGIGDTVESADKAMNEKKNEYYAQKGQARRGSQKDEIIAQAKAALDMGAPVEKVHERMRALGVDPDELGTAAPKEPPDTESQAPREHGPRKAAVDEDRINRALEQMPAADHEYWAPVFAKAMSKMADDPDYAPHLAASVAEKPRPLTTEEVASLTADLPRLTARHDEAVKAVLKARAKGDDEGAARALLAKQSADAALTLNHTALREGARSNARALAMMNVVVKDDYSLARNTARAEVSYGGKVPKEVQAKIDALSAKIAEQDKRIENISKARKARTKMTDEQKLQAKLEKRIERLRNQVEARKRACPI